MTAAMPAADIDIPAAGAVDSSTTPAGSQCKVLQRGQTASWRAESITVERRKEERRACDLAAQLLSVDRHGRASGGPPLEVRIRDLSAHGVGISHPAPMPHKLVVLAFESESEGPVRVLVRLKWCRFKRTDLYESGGQILRVLDPGDEPGQQRAEKGVRQTTP
jgi:hypothetical protein